MRNIICNRVIRIVLILLAIVLLQSYLYDGATNVERKNQRRSQKVRTLCDERVLDKRKRRTRELYSFHSLKKNKSLHKLITSCIIRIQQLVDIDNRYIHFTMNCLCIEFLLEKLQYLSRPQGEDVHLSYFVQ